VLTGRLCDYDRDADGITALLDVLRAARALPETQERALSTLAFLTASAANLEIVVSSGGVSVLVPLLGAKCEAVALAAAGVIRRLLALPAGQVWPLVSALSCLASWWSCSERPPHISFWLARCDPQSVSMSRSRPRPSSAGC
jgi:hypothetical protein